MTYSIVGFDVEHGEIGVALQSYYYGCAPRTLLATPAVGIAVMQMVPDVTYGSEGMAAMRAGRPPADVLTELTSADPSQAVRQVAMMDANGNAAAFTGRACIPASGHLIGRNCAAQGAMVETENVWKAMVESFESASGTLAERLLLALRSGETEGGDIRGRRAGALLVVATTLHASWVRSRPIDIRIDDNPNPLLEMARHLELQRHMGEVELAFERGLGGDLEGAISDYNRIAARAPDDPDVTMRYSIMLAQAGDIAGAREQLMRMTRVHRGWEKVTGRLVAAGFLPDDDELLEGFTAG